MEANTVLKAKQSAYKTVLDEAGQLRIRNTKNYLFNTAPNNPHFRISDHRLDTIIELAKQVWPPERLQQLAVIDEKLGMVHHLSPQGKILETEFVIQSPEHTITIEELELLESILHQNLAYEILWQDHKAKANFAFTVSRISFQLIQATINGQYEPGQKIVNVVLTPPLPDDLQNQ